MGPTPRLSVLAYHRVLPERAASFELAVLEAKDTGKPISQARLTAIPWTRFSADAERELEETGKIKRTHLAERGSVLESESAETETE